MRQHAARGAIVNTVFQVAIMTLGLAKGVVVTAFFCLLFCALVPVIALVYGEQRIVLPGLVLALTMPLGALQVPIWVLYRREPAPL